MTGCPCGCASRYGWKDLLCVTLRPIGEPQDWTWAGASAAERGMGRLPL